jgi:hypothetical protein
MIFQKELIGNSRAGQAQWEDVLRGRNAYAANEAMHAAALRAAGMTVNEGLIPTEVYQEFDNVTVERFRSDDGDTFLNDLLPMSRSVNIGRLVHKFRRASDAGQTQTSMTGQIGVKMDQVEYNFDGSIIPIHDTGFYRNWREWNAQRAEGFDALIDDQRESVAALRRRAADNFLDGHKDKNGQLIVVDGISWAGMRADTRVAQVDIGSLGINFDFTDTTKTYEQIEAAFKQVRDVLWITNNCEKDAVYYISREIASNMERNSSEFASSENKILQRLAGLMGVAAIKTSSKLSGNEFMAFPLDGSSVRPIVGMGVNTVAMPRPVYNSNYEFVVWGAIGFEVRTDYANRKCALFAQELT